MDMERGRPSRRTERLLEGALQLRHAARLTARVCSMICEGMLQLGDRVPPERELARMARISSSSVRTGIDYLATAGILKVKQGSGAFVAMSAKELAECPLAQRHPLESSDLCCICEVRQVLEGNLAALAAERCRGKYSTRLAEELTEMYVAVDDPREYLVHELAFHRTIAQAAGNPILCDLMTRIASAIYDAQRGIDRTCDELRNSADRHRKIFRAIRAHKPDEARKAVEDYLAISKIQSVAGRLPDELNQMIDPVTIHRD